MLTCIWIVDPDISDEFQILFTKCIPKQMFLRISKVSMSNNMQLFMVILLTYLGLGPRDRSVWAEVFLYTLWSSCNNLHSTQSRNLHSCSQGIIFLHKSPQLQNCVKDIFFNQFKQFQNFVQTGQKILEPTFQQKELTLIWKFLQARDVQLFLQ